MRNSIEKPEKVFFQIRIEKDIRDDFKEYCSQHSINGSDIVRKLIAQWLYSKTHDIETKTTARRHKA